MDAFGTKEKLMKVITEPKYIFKYLSLEKFLDILINKRLYLTRINLWEDKYEGFPIDRIFKYVIEIDLYRKLEKELPNFAELFSRSAKNCIYAQSWTWTPYESEAMWKIYGMKSSCLRVKVALKDIKEATITSFKARGFREPPNFYRVIYDNDFNNLPGIIEGKTEIIVNDKTFCQKKRKAYQHENEYRVSITSNDFIEKISDATIVDDIKNFNITISNKIEYFDYNPDCIKQVRFDPRLNENMEEILKSIIKIYGYNIPVAKSELFGTI